VLDVGSGWGSLCVDLALSGAVRVVGLDIKAELVAFATRHLHERFPQLTSIVEFAALDLRCFSPEAAFDYVVSKDSFEHILELDRMLLEIKNRLRPGGRLFAGFGPLYPSPYGDHDRRKTSLKPWGLWGRLVARIPWGHLIMEARILEMSNRNRKRMARSVHDLGLNGLAASDYYRLFRESGFVLRSLRINQSTALSSRILTRLARSPSLADYCTHNIYAILEKPA
jgi:SAM-dependent methyltransferase